MPYGCLVSRVLNLEEAAPRPAFLQWLLAQPETIPAAAVIAVVLGSMVCNLFVGIRYQLDLLPTMLLPAGLLVVALVYSVFRPAPTIAESVFYFALWMMFLIFGERLSYLGASLGLPLRDADFAAADRALGFNWLAWRHFVEQYPWFVWLQRVTYETFYAQPLVMLVAASFLMPRRRNAEMFIALVVATAITVVVSTLVPAIGPGDALGFATMQGTVIRELQANPTAQALPYAGIVSLPSFHTVISLLMVYGVRGMPWLFPVAIVLDMAMMISVPLGGDHYLVDMLAGAVVCVISILAARAVTRRTAIAADRLTA
jgi:PAP2 superfamily